MHLCRRMVVAAAVGMLLAGCRTATRVTEVPRVDLELTGGNRGYLVGAPPETAEWKTTRQMVESTIEVPSLYKPKHSGAPVSLDQVAPPEADLAASGLSGGERVGKYDTYVVQKGDSLWSIAAKPEIYGKATQWRRIYDANRDVLKSPERVRAGMTLKIPRGDTGAGSTTYGDEGVAYKK